MDFVYILFILLISIFLGFELINKVPSTLHTPLMSGANAVSGITIIGAIQYASLSDSKLVTYVAIASAFFALVNVVGGYLVTDRMLKMFKKENTK